MQQFVEINATAFSKILKKVSKVLRYELGYVIINLSNSGIKRPRWDIYLDSRTMDTY